MVTDEHCAKWSDFNLKPGKTHWLWLALLWVMEFVGNQNSEGDKPTQTKAKGVIYMSAHKLNLHSWVSRSMPHLPPAWAFRAWRWPAVLQRHSDLFLMVPGSFPCFGVSFIRIKEYNRLLQGWSTFFLFSFFSVHVSVSPHFAALISVALESFSLVPHSHVAISCMSKLSHEPSLENSEVKLLQTDANLRSPYILQNSKSKLC